MMPSKVFAAPNVSISANKDPVEKGDTVTVTVTITDTAAWNLKIDGTGAATCSKKEVDVTADGNSTTKNFTLACTPNQVGKITIKVTGDITSGSAENKDVKENKEITVVEARSSVNTLSSLKIDGDNIPGFSSSKTNYTINDVNKNSVNISATATDSKSSISGAGNKSLQYGKNTFKIVVTAENGTKRVYTIDINRKDTRSSNNNLKSLSIDKGKIDYSKDSNSYTVKVDHSVNEVKISAVAEDSKATITGTGTKSLKDYTNDFTIEVKAENGAKKTYVVKVIRKDADGNYGQLSSDNSVKTIKIPNNDFKFDNNVKEYKLLVEENVQNLEMEVIPNDSKATVSISNNTNLKPGLNKVSVIVTSEKGDTNEFLFNVYKIGEEKVEESTENSNNKQIYILLIISFIEFLIIIGLLFIKNNKKEKGNYYPNV